MNAVAWIFLGILIGMSIFGFLLVIITILKHKIMTTRLERMKREEEDFLSTLKLVLSTPVPNLNKNPNDELKNPYKIDDDSSTEW